MGWLCCKKHPEVIRKGNCWLFIITLALIFTHFIVHFSITNQTNQIMITFPSCAQARRWTWATWSTIRWSFSSESKWSIVNRLSRFDLLNFSLVDNFLMDFALDITSCCIHFWCFSCPPTLWCTTLVWASTGRSFRQWLDTRLCCTSPGWLTRVRFVSSRLTWSLESNDLIDIDLILTQYYWVKK